MIAIGIDIGGTSIKGAAVNEEGKVFETYKLPIVIEDGQDKIVADLIELTKKYIDEQKFDEEIAGIGIGIPGSIDSKNGIVMFSPNLKWKNLKIVEKFEKAFNFPVFITNDANAAALGEKVFGAGRKYNNLAMITLGTGVGSGFIIDGKIYDGYLGQGAEFGHTTLVYDGLQCGCGRRGCYEMYASANALKRQTKEALDSDLEKKSLMWKMMEEGKVQGKTAFEAAKLGDELANKVIDQYVKYLSEGLLNICNMMRPEIIVLSGGVANQKGYLINKVKAYCEKCSYGYPGAPVTEIAVAEVGYESGIVGAACLILAK